VDTPAGIPDRLTIVETITFQQAGQGAACADFRYARHIQQSESPHEQRLTADSQWKSLPTGDVQKVGMLVVVNCAPASKTNKVLEICNRDCFPWVIPAGEHFRGNPQRAEDLLIRCRDGECPCTVHVFPL